MDFWTSVSSVTFAVRSFSTILIASDNLFQNLVYQIEFRFSHELCVEMQMLVSHPIFAQSSFPTSAFLLRCADRYSDRISFTSKSFIYRIAIVLLTVKDWILTEFSSDLAIQSF